MNTKRFSVVVPENVDVVLGEIAKKQGKRKSEIIRIIVLKFLLSAGEIDENTFSDSKKISPGGSPWGRKKKKAKSEKEIEKIDKDMRDCLAGLRSRRGKTKIKISGNVQGSVVAAKASNIRIDNSQKNLRK